MKRKLLAILTSALLLCACIPLGAIPVAAATSGTTGNCTWTLDDDGHLTISGYGEMGDCAWGENADLWGTAITSVTIEEGVTTIGEYAFLICKSLESITIPDSVTTIGNGAFRSCSSLTSVTIPDSVTSIGEYAFGNCEALTSVTIPDGVTVIEGWVFCGCKSLELIVIPDSVTTIGRYAFSHCASLVSVTIPNSVTTIEGSAFDYCTSLTSVTIPNGVASLGDWTFGYCTSLTSVTIPDSVTSIGYAVFSNCSCLTDVYYGGRKADKANIKVGSDNNRFLYATWHYAADPISATVTHSVMDTDNGNGLAFRFELSADGVTMKNRTEADLTAATINYLGTDCKLVGMGAVVTNSATIGETAFTHADVNAYDVIDVPTVYLQEADEDSCAFAARIIDIPDTAMERTLYARPYYVVEVDGEQITVYGDVDSASCAAYM